MRINGYKDLTSSPCRGICTATALGDEICRGCGRTFQEVATWNALSEETKMQINKRIRGLANGSR